MVEILCNKCEKRLIKTERYKVTIDKFDENGYIYLSPVDVDLCKTCYNEIFKDVGVKLIG